MDMLPPQAPPAIVTSVNQHERDLLRRLGETQAWLHAQQDDLPDPYVSADDREHFLQGIDAFWDGAVTGTSVPGQTGTTRRQAFAARLTQTARDSASLYAGRHLLPSSAVDLIRRATESGTSLPPNLRASELLIGDEPLAGTLVLQDDTQPDTVLLFGTRTGWERFASIDELLCEIEERLQIHLFQTDDDHAFDEVDTHFLRSRPIQGPVFETIAERLATAYHEAVSHAWDEETFCADWEDRLNKAMQVSSLIDLHRLSALPSLPMAPLPQTPVSPTAVLSRVRRSPPVKPPVGTGTASGRAAGAARRVGEHLGPVAGATHRVASDVARQWGVGVPGNQALSPGVSTLPRPQDMFSRRYSASEVTLPTGTEPGGNVHYVDGNPYIQREGLPYRVQYDPASNAWRLSSLGPTQGTNTGPIIDLGPNGQWEIRFPASRDGVMHSTVPQASTPPVHRDTGVGPNPPSQVGQLPTPPPMEVVNLLSPDLTLSPAPIDLPPVALSELPKLLKDIIREELARQFDNDVVGALTLFRRLRRWHDGGPLMPSLTPIEIDAWNAAMAGMRDRLRNVRTPSPHESTIGDQLTDGDLDVVTPEGLLPTPRHPGTPRNEEGALTDLLTTPAGPTSPRELTPETLHAWSETVNQFVERPRLISSPAAGSSTQASMMPSTHTRIASGPIIDAPLPAYLFDRPDLETQIIEEMTRLMPSASDAKALFKSMEQAFRSGEIAPRLTRVQENAWRGALTHMRLPRATSYRPRRMDAATLSKEDLKSIRHQLNRRHMREAFEPLVYLRDKNKQLVELTDAQKNLWKDVVDHIGKRSYADGAPTPSAKRSATSSLGRMRKEINDLSVGDLRSIARRLINELDKEAQLKIFRQKVHGISSKETLTDGEQRAWNSALHEARNKFGRFAKDLPSDAIREFSATDMRHLRMELKERLGFRLGEDAYDTNALMTPPAHARHSLQAVDSLQWQQAVDTIRRNRRAPPATTMTEGQIAQGLWYVPRDQWPASLYYYGPSDVFARRQDHLFRMPFTRLESIGAEGIPMFTSPPNTMTTSLPRSHITLLPTQEANVGSVAGAPIGSLGARSGWWLRIRTAEVADDLTSFVELYRVGDSASTTYVLRSTERNTAAGLTDVWLDNPFEINPTTP